MKMTEPHEITAYLRAELDARQRDTKHFRMMIELLEEIKRLRKENEENDNLINKLLLEDKRLRKEIDRLDPNPFSSYGKEIDEPFSAYGRFARQRD
jgi:hypothetical protein